jgi:signal transduction histidine kinase
METTSQNTTVLLVIGSTLVVLLLGATLILLFLFIQKKKKEYLIEKRIFKESFNLELAKSQNEIRERALENLSWEIHDNVGQLLSVSKMQLNRLEMKVSDNNKKALNEVTELVSKSLQDLRALSKSLNPISIKNIGLLKALELEIDRYNRLNFVKASLEVINKPFRLDKEKETILFRIVQEFITNAIKHAKASELNVTLLYENNDLEIIVKDNGVGFDINKKSTKRGIGLFNMKGRAELIKAAFNMTSKKGEGTTGYIRCNKEKVIL